jgi:hypothetical protein
MTRIHIKVLLLFLVLSIAALTFAGAASAGWSWTDSDGWTWTDDGAPSGDG